MQAPSIWHNLEKSLVRMCSVTTFLAKKDPCEDFAGAAPLRPFLDLRHQNTHRPASVAQIPDTFIEC